MTGGRGWGWQELARQTAEEQRRQAEEARMRRNVLDKQATAARTP